MVPRETDWIPAFRLSLPTGPFERQVAGSLRRTTGLRGAKLGSRPSSHEALGHNFPSAVGRSCRQPSPGSIRRGNPYDGGLPPCFHCDLVSVSAARSPVFSRDLRPPRSERSHCRRLTITATRKRPKPFPVPVSLRVIHNACTAADSFVTITELEELRTTCR